MIKQTPQSLNRLKIQGFMWILKSQSFATDTEASNRSSLFQIKWEIIQNYE